MVVTEIQVAGGSAPAFVINLNNPENAAIYDLGLPLVAANDVGYKSRGYSVLNYVFNDKPPNGRRPRYENRVINPGPSPVTLWVTEARRVLVTATSWSCVLGPKLRL